MGVGCETAEHGDPNSNHCEYALQMLLPSLEQLSPRLFSAVDISPKLLTVLSAHERLPLEDTYLETNNFVSVLGARHSPRVVAVPDANTQLTRFLVIKNGEWVAEANRRGVPMIPVSMIPYAKILRESPQMESLLIDIALNVSQVSTKTVPGVIRTKRDLLLALLSGLR